ncbi:MAG: sodium:proton antiporter [Rikenellaceae bacterium]
MKKIVLFSVFLIAGLVCSQTIPTAVGVEVFASYKWALNVLLYTALAFIMINVGREFELDKSNVKSYTEDYFIAMATAAAPWIFTCLYYMYLLPEGSFASWDAWKENLILSRFAAPTSAGILFAMLAGAGLRKSWIYKKTHVLAIFDDLDTILLMIPLQIFMIGMKWQLAVIVLVIVFCLYMGWSKLGKFNMKQDWKSIIFYSIILVAMFEGVYNISKNMFGAEAAIHIEVLLPAFVLGMVMKHQHGEPSKNEENIATAISYIFMFLVGISSPLFVGVDFSQTGGTSVLASVGAMSWGEIIGHVCVVTTITNLGKMVPIFFYRDRLLSERLALSIGMFTRGEVGAGIIFVAIGYNIGGPLLAISLLTLVANLILTGFFVVIVKHLAVKSEKRLIELGMSES